VDACSLATKPLVTAALGVFDGFSDDDPRPRKNADGEFNPTYRCLFAEPPPAGTAAESQQAAFSARWPAYSA
jgi:adenylyltransferase/sulfurtransferase